MGRGRAASRGGERHGQEGRAQEQGTERGGSHEGANARGTGSGCNPSRRPRFPALLQVTPPSPRGMR
ncbi:hypothetical protein D187_007735 [Cystobacter fuscus DSM 2262]|uniref:Uncharacterized protein n=1 Tax=Cystobacter fuscus (strain ATCC 25194 / DSM 2262 / NBRC 100088 / M29) TaxID=1242864 RepID=S9QIU5_CYSF2|nr:hypothetical protein D187_007735 [Cystobacter fuscus DSM 2262]